MKKRYNVVLKSKQISQEWWGQQWCINISKCIDSFYSNLYNLTENAKLSRLERGRTYLRKGNVGVIEIEGGRIEAKVNGTMPEPYTVRIIIEPVSEGVAGRASLQIQEIDDLRKGIVPNNCKDLFTVENGLFPKSSEIHLFCSCPDYDYSYMCKHTASVLYAVGSILDFEPLLLFKLRGINVEEILDSRIDKITNQLFAEVNSIENKRIISDDQISELFGIEVATEIPVSDNNIDESDSVTVIEIAAKKKVALKEQTDKKDKVKKNPLEGKSLRQYTLDGRFISAYNSYDEGFEKTGIGISNIKRACMGYKKSAGGYLWKIESSDSPFNNIEPIAYVSSDGSSRPIICFDDSGTIISRYNSVAEACRETGVNSKSIRDAANGIQKHAGGYVWEYEQKQ